ncbi:MAG: hypothetical protein IJ418_00500 [Clostridia bacterium]|nr:hypothetical protein [Clostridia bacterium]
MDQMETYEKLMGIVVEGVESVHKIYMAEIDKTTPEKLPEVAKDYAMAMMGFATLMTSMGILRPYTPWANCCAS